MHRIMLYVRVFYQSVSVCRLARRIFARLFTSRTVGNQLFLTCSQSILLVFCLFFTNVDSPFRDFLCFPTAEWVEWAKTSKLRFSEVAQIQLTCFIYSLTSAMFVILKAFVLMRARGRSSPVAVSVIICFF